MYQLKEKPVTFSFSIKKFKKGISSINPLLNPYIFSIQDFSTHDL